MLESHRVHPVPPRGRSGRIAEQSDRSAFEDYLRDASGYQGSCERVFYPQNEAHVVELLRRAGETRTPVTVAGARTGLTGAAVPHGGWVLATDRFAKIRTIRREARGGRAVVEPGVRLSELARAVEREGLFYPPDPTEQSACIGGTLATNASGPRSYGFGPTRDYVLGLRVVLPQGDVLEVPRGRHFASARGAFEIERPGASPIVLELPNLRLPDCKHAAGYFIYPKMDLVDLFIGSEGTLGVVTEATLKLLPRPPGLMAGVAFFPEETQAIDFVIDVRGSASLRPAALEFFDRSALDLIMGAFPQIPGGAGCAVFFEEILETDEHSLEGWLSALKRHGADVESSWFTTSRTQDETFRAFRHRVAVEVNERVARRGVRKVGTDMAVPDEALRASLAVYRKAVEGFEALIFGHIGDNHLHVNILPRDRAEVERGLAVYEEIAREIVALGGTVSAEHGIGKAKRNLLKIMVGEEQLGEFASLKRALDPQGILSPGNLFES